ncbi:MAG: M15 family metallopeptidase [Hyphomicrobiales bacterium]|nr:M15 family metallopeptidase [Hyphomicrobiales bacterium]
MRHRGFPDKLATRVAGMFALVVWLGTCPLTAFAQNAHAVAVPIPDDIWRQMQDRSWHETLDATQCERPETCVCPPRETLVLLSVPFRDFQGKEGVGELIVAKDVADEVAGVFVDIFESRQFRIESMELVNRFDGDDVASMAANNTSAFNCRLTTGGSSLSAHATGTAIDINPVQNPYVKGETTLPPAGQSFDEEGERSGDGMGVVVAGDVVTDAFAKRGWTWGGDWTSLKDYQHFSKDGR